MHVSRYHTDRSKRYIKLNEKPDWLDQKVGDSAQVDAMVKGKMFTDA